MTESPEKSHDSQEVQQVAPWGVLPTVHYTAGQVQVGSLCHYLDPESYQFG